MLKTRYGGYSTCSPRPPLSAESDHRLPCLLLSELPSFFSLLNRLPTVKKTFGPDTHGPYVFRDEINPVRHYKNDGPLATIEDKACAPCALQCVSRPDFSPTPKSLQEEVMGGAYTSTATPENIQETRDARVMAKFAGAYALYKLGPSALCAEDESKWGGLLSSLGVPNVEGTTWGGDSYVTGDGDDSAENGVLAGGVVRGWLTSEAR